MYFSVGTSTVKQVSVEDVKLTYLLSRYKWLQLESSGQQWWEQWEQWEQRRPGGPASQEKQQVFSRCSDTRWHPEDPGAALPQWTHLQLAVQWEQRCASQRRAWALGAGSRNRYRILDWRHTHTGLSLGGAVITLTPANERLAPHHLINSALGRNSNSEQEVKRGQVAKVWQAGDISPTHSGLVGNIDGFVNVPQVHSGKFRTAEKKLLFIWWNWCVTQTTIKLQLSVAANWNLRVFKHKNNQENQSHTQVSQYNCLMYCINVM